MCRFPLVRVLEVLFSCLLRISGVILHFEHTLDACQKVRVAAGPLIGSRAKEISTRPTHGQVTNPLAVIHLAVAT